MSTTDRPMDWCRLTFFCNSGELSIEHRLDTEALDIPRPLDLPEKPTRVDLPSSSDFHRIWMDTRNTLEFATCLVNCLLKIETSQSALLLLLFCRQPIFLSSMPCLSRRSAVLADRRLHSAIVLNPARDEFSRWLILYLFSPADVQRQLFFCFHMS